jgi:hypothetical protein
MTGTYERPNGERSPLDVTYATALDCAIAAADAAAQFAAECAAHQCAVTAAFGVPNPAALGYTFPEPYPCPKSRAVRIAYARPLEQPNATPLDEADTRALAGANAIAHHDTAAHAGPLLFTNAASLAPAVAAAHAGPLPYTNASSFVPAVASADPRAVAAAHTVTHARANFGAHTSAHSAAH